MRRGGTLRALGPLGRRVNSHRVASWLYSGNAIRRTGKPSLGVLYDADFGSTIDIPLGLAVLYGLQVKNESRVVAVTTSRPSINSAAFADVLVRFYTGEPGGFVAAQSIGMPTGTAPEDTPMLSSVLAKPYGRGISKN